MPDMLTSAKRSSVAVQDDETISLDIEARSEKDYPAVQRRHRFSTVSSSGGSGRESPPQIVQYMRPPENLQSPNRLSVVEPPVRLVSQDEKREDVKGESVEVAERRIPVVVQPTHGCTSQGESRVHFRRKYSKKAQSDQDPIVVRRTRSSGGAWAFLRRTLLGVGGASPGMGGLEPEVANETDAPSRHRQSRRTTNQDSISAKRKVSRIIVEQIPEVPVTKVPHPPTQPQQSRRLGVQRSTSSAAAMSFLRRTFRRTSVRAQGRPKQRSKSHDFDVRKMSGERQPFDNNPNHPVQTNGYVAMQGSLSETVGTSTGDFFNKSQVSHLEDPDNSIHLSEKHTFHRYHLVSPDPRTYKDLPPPAPSVVAASNRFSTGGCLPFGSSQVGRCLSPIQPCLTPIQPCLGIQNGRGPPTHSSGHSSLASTVYHYPMRKVSRESRHDQMNKVHVAQKPKTVAKLSIRMKNDDVLATTRVSSRKSVEEPHIGKYRLLKTIGKGNFAKVKLARHIPTGKEVAIKIIDKTQLNPGSLQKLLREVRIMKNLDHPNIVKLFQVIETERTLYLVMEYASGGEVFDYLVLNGRMKEKEARAKFRQIVSAVQYCHRKKIIHRDLKAENLLLDSEMNIKIADFGFSNEFVPGSKLDTFCGSPPYAAPELFQGKRYDGPEVDIWSLGVILYTLVSGSLPFDGTTLRELRERVLRGKYRIPFYMSTDCEHLLKKFLVLNPSRRVSLEVVMKDRWLNTGYEENELRPFVEPIMNISDEKRINILIGMGYTKSDVTESLCDHKYDDCYASYLLLERKSTEFNSRISFLDSSSSGICKDILNLPEEIVTSGSRGFQRSNSITSSKSRGRYCGPENSSPDSFLGTSILQSQNISNNNGNLSQKASENPSSTRVVERN